METFSLRAPACGCAVTCESDGRQKRLADDNAAAKPLWAAQLFFLPLGNSGETASG